MKLKGDDYFCEVVVKEGTSDGGKIKGKKRFYLHEVELKEKLGNVFSTRFDPSTSSSSKSIISKLINEVKNKKFNQTSGGVNRNNTIRPQGARGQFIRKHNTGEAIIQLFKSADASTVIHELGHFFLDDMRKFSDNETTAAQLDAINHTVTTTVLI